MPLKTTHSSVDISYSYNFVLKWKLESNDLKVLLKSHSDVVLRSDLYRFKTVQDLRFFLEIQKLNCDSDYIVADICGSKKWHFRLIYAFVVCDDRAFQLMASSQLSFLTPCRVIDSLYSDDVTIQCLVSAYPSLLSSEDDKELLQKDQVTVDFEGKPSPTLSKPYNNEMVTSFIREGIIPDFTVENAIDILNELVSIRDCEVLKILCEEYLLKNITAQKFSLIARSAIDHELRRLECKCLEEIADEHYEIKEKAGTDFLSEQ